MISGSDFDELVAIAGTVLPEADLTGARAAQGQDHDVVLLPGVAAVRVARHERAAAALPRRTELLARLATTDLPLRVPEPLTEVLETGGGRTAVAVSWVPGAPLAHDAGDVRPAALRDVLEALRSVDVAGLADVLDQPHAYAGRHRWQQLMQLEAVPRLPQRLRDEAQRRTDAAAALDAAPMTLVHGDLAGHHVHWSDGQVVGLLDWDLASAFDPAVDAACLASFGWEPLRAAVDEPTYERARVWWGTFGIEQIVASVLNGDAPAEVQTYVDAATRWLDRTS